MSTHITLVAEESPNLDTITYRGSARLCDLTRISQVDVFDQDTNPQGLQRDLTRAHALGAYEYVNRPARKSSPRAFPEVMLNVRDKKVVTVDQLGDAGTEYTLSNGETVTAPTIVALTFDLDKIDKAKSVKVSRVDGNHRLFYGMGDGKDRGPLEAYVPFSITVNLDREAETGIFVDTNAEQKGLNTSHLSVMRERLTPDEIAFENAPARYLALRLANDAQSPWHGIVHMGGSKAGAKAAGIRRPVTFTALQSAIQRILRKSTYLTSMETVDGKYGLIRNYWLAVRLACPEAFEDGSELLLLKNLGVNTLAEFGAMVIDRSMVVGNIEIEDMAGLVQHGLGNVDWHKESADVAGMSGNRAVLQLAARMAKDLPKDGRGTFSPVEVRGEGEPEVDATVHSDAPAE